jgi:hypothetical protein
MRRILAVILALVLLMPAPAWAQSDGFAEFWQEFSAAARKGDKEKIKALTRFPFLFDGKPHGVEAFDPIWQALFTPSLRACLGKAKPVKEYQATSYSAFCSKFVYLFDRAPGGWRFQEFGYDHG